MLMVMLWKLLLGSEKNENKNKTKTEGWTCIGAVTLISAAGLEVLDNLIINE